MILGAVAAALGHLPPALGRSVGRGLGDLAFVALRRRRRRALTNLRLAFPELGARARRRVCRRSFEHFGMTMLELASMLARPVDETLATVTLDGLPNLRQAMERSGRALVLTAHLGNWEILSAAHRLAGGYPLAVVVRPLDVPALNALAERLRAKTGVELIDKRRALRPVLGALARGAMVGILLDQNASRREGVFVPFFGRAASTSRSIAVLALRTGAPIVPIFARREPGGRHRVSILPAIESPGEASGEPAVIELTARCTQVVEAAIREAPEQWLWMHHRWRTRPEGERRDAWS